MIWVHPLDKIKSIRSCYIVIWITASEKVPSNMCNITKTCLSNILKILPPKNENFQIKNSDILHISAQNIDCGYTLEPAQLGDSNAYPQSIFLSRNKKNNVYPCKPQFYYVKKGSEGVKIIRACFCDEFCRFRSICT